MEARGIEPQLAPDGSASHARGHRNRTLRGLNKAPTERPRSPTVVRMNAVMVGNPREVAKQGKTVEDGGE